MNFCIFLILLIASYASAQTSGQKVGEVRNGVRVLTQLTCTASGPQCAEDCQTLMVCGLAQDPIQSTSCGQLNTDKPYCIGTTCVADPGDSEECAASLPFTCTSVGLFPDPNDCSTYISCLPSGNADINRCPTGYVFNSKQGSCTSSTGRTFSTPSTCSKVVCPKTNFTFIPYAPNPAYYVFCTDTEKVMFKCPDEINQVFDSASGTCQYKCTNTGNYEDRQLCTNYYVCSRQSGQLNAVNVKCPAGYYFRNGGCVFGSCTNAIDVNQF